MDGTRLTRPVRSAPENGFRVERYWKVDLFPSGTTPPSASPSRCAARRTLGVAEFQCGGGGGIRTHGTLAGTAVFKTAALNHSTTPPTEGRNQKAESRSEPSARRTTARRRATFRTATTTTNSRPA